MLLLELLLLLLRLELLKLLLYSFVGLHRDNINEKRKELPH